jgi:TatD DNase family protein
MLADAHNHLHDTRLDPWREEVMHTLSACRLGAAVVNGTREDDWGAVAAVAARYPWVMPSFGLHPWYVPGRSKNWQDSLRARVAANPRCGIGEIGLDRWVEGHDLAEQLACFRWQLALATERGLPVTIHCVRAWGALGDVLAQEKLPACGCLIHAYGGSLEQMREFAARGAYFSFSAYFLHERKAAQREVFRAIPADRLLVETDAPDLAPPDAENAHLLRDAEGKVVNHPGNLALTYAALARLRGVAEEELERQVAENFARLFGRSV